MRDIVNAVISDLKLDYAVTLISGGASGNYEIVIWDKPRDSYFSVRLTAPPDTPSEAVAGQLRQQLDQRVAALRSGSDLFRERRPVRISPRPAGDGARVA